MKRQHATSRRTTVARAASIALAFAAALTAHAEPMTITGHDIRLIDTASPDELLPGTTQPRRNVTLGASFDGLLMTILVSEGDRVRAGDPIARLDDRVARAALDLAIAEAGHTARIDRAAAQLARNEQILERTQAAHDRGAANGEELDNARTSAALARAELAEAKERHEAAQRSLDEARARLEEHTVRAPFDGVVVSLAVEEGAVLKTSDPIAELSDIDRMSVELYLPAAAALNIEKGEAYALSLDAPIDRVLWARARYVEPRIDPTSNTMRTVFDFETTAGRIPSGLLVMPATRAPNEAELAFIAGTGANLASVSDEPSAD